MSQSSDNTQFQLWLSEDPRTPGSAVSWVGSLVAIGGIASRAAVDHLGRQLIVAVSVPCRDFAAVLVGCGWVLDRQAVELDDPLETLRELDAGTPVRLITEREVVVDNFVRLHDEDDPRVVLRWSQWIGSSIKAMAKWPQMEGPLRSPRPRLGNVGRWWGLESTWDNWLASPPADLAVIGTRKWLQEDLAVGFGQVGGPVIGGSELDEIKANTIAGLLLPDDGAAATWSTRLIASSGLAEQLPLPEDVRAAVLDGAGAIKHLSEIEVPVVFCILDRSVADEAAGELVMQLRNTRGEPCSLTQDIGGRLSPGVEAIAFTVAL